jgi:hypothetical protein
MKLARSTYYDEPELQPIGEATVRIGLRGGAGRTRTSEQTVMSEPRRLHGKRPIYQK